MASKGTKSNPIIDKDKTVTANTPKVTGLKLERTNDNKFTATWVNKATYSKAVFKYRFNTGKNGVWGAWSNGRNVTGATSTVLTMDWSKYYPAPTTYLNGIQICVITDVADKTEYKTYYVKTTKKYHKQKIITKYNQAIEYYTYDVKAPSKPKLSVADGESRTTFSWEVPNSDNKSAYIFRDVAVSTKAVKDGGNLKWTEVPWPSAAAKSGATGTFDHIFGAADLADHQTSYTIFGRVRARGPQNTSDWGYAKITYAWPYAATNLSATVSNANTGYSVAMKWNKVVDANHPSSHYMVEYLIDKPKDANLNPPDGANWSAIANDPTEHKPATAQSTTFSIPNRVGTEECLWLRVVQKHVQRLETPSAAYLAKKFDNIEAPSISSVSYDARHGTWEVTVKNESSFTCTIKLFIQGSPMGERTVAADGSVTYEVAKVISSSAVAVTARATYGSYTAENSTNFDPTLSADDPYPYRPYGLRVTKASGTTVNLSWNAVLKGVTKSYVTIANNPDEWDQDNPDFLDTVEISGGKNTASIGGLEYGNSYYFKVQSENSNGRTDYSSGEPASIYLDPSTAPAPRIDITGRISETSRHGILVSWNWDDWATAESVILTWSRNQSDGSSNRLTETVVNKNVQSGVQSFEIPPEEVERGYTWWVWARFQKGVARSNASENYITLAVTPQAPTNVTFVREAKTGSDESGKTTTRLSWKNGWADTNKTEVSWSTNPNAWDNVDGADQHEVTCNTVLIPELDLGKIWYARVKVSYDERFWAQSEIQQLDLRTKPTVTNVKFAESTISQYGKLDVSWTYINEDLSEQANALVRIYNEQGDVVYTETVASSDKAVTIYAEGKFTGDTQYYATVEARSANGIPSGESTSTGFYVINIPIAEITSTSLVEVTLDEGEETERTVLALTQMPLTITISGAGATGRVMAYIERSASVFLARPDESQAYGFEGELVAVAEGQNELTITQDDLHTNFDEGGEYRIVAIAMSDIGVKSEPVTLDFTVVWTHKAPMPTTETVAYVTDEEAMIAKITPTAPEDAIEGDTFDIYRLSSDMPELIVQNGEWGTTYVDPYPAFGFNAGHRVVYKTATGSYIAEGDQIAWLDCIPPYGDPEQVTLTNDGMLINFGINEVNVKYNLDLTHTWEKDFTETKYLGGSIQGDWNPAVTRKVSAGGVMIRLIDESDILLMKRLAVYTGICHVRTPDGASFAADVQVTEAWSSEKDFEIADYTLDITRVDSETLDGLTLAEWEERNGLE